MASAWRRFSPIGRGDAVASFLIGERYGPGRWDASFGGLVALGFQKRGAAWKIAQGSQLELLWLHAIADGARHHLDWEMRLRAYAGRATAHILARRRPGRLKEVIAMAMSRPYINSRMVSERLDITSAGAIKLLTNAVEASLLLERSGQNSYRTYAIPLGPGAAAASWRSDPMDVGTPNFWDEDENTLSSQSR
ncbi:hypothetical protein U5A82_00140 [Sphingobium sp. CR2-8]|uniref:hypothetical protein n=1 Tax=Sphingobium sp. CR2-8 TaxID=1306534 RepID=UPI002DBE9FB8|nr:hypothetical protein [Sphingobium sp. CR2-8]MEC3908938.1 hypothetical protein [Sphingobium sp. CR2-8]